MIRVCTFYYSKPYKVGPETLIVLCVFDQHETAVEGSSRVWT